MCLQNLGSGETAPGEHREGEGTALGPVPLGGTSGKLRNDQVRIRGGLEASPEGRESFVKLCP